MMVLASALILVCSVERALCGMLKPALAKPILPKVVAKARCGMPLAEPVFRQLHLKAVAQLTSTQTAW